MNFKGFIREDVVKQPLVEAMERYLQEQSAGAGVPAAYTGP